MMRWLAIAAAIIAYSVLAHYTNESPRNGNLGALVALCPIVLLALVLAWRSTHRVVMIAGVALGCVALWAAWPELTRHYDLIFWLQHLGMQLILFTTFARTLVAGRQPLCTRFAEALHPPLTREQEIYTRQVTVAWAVFFAVIALVSTLLFFLAPLAVWSVFDNFMILPLVILMFIVEYQVRRRTLPNMQHVHILESIKAFRNTPVPRGPGSSQ